MLDLLIPSFAENIFGSGGIETDDRAEALDDGQTVGINRRDIRICEQGNLCVNVLCFFGIIRLCAQIMELFGKSVFHFLGGRRGKGQRKNPVHADSVFHAALENTGNQNHCLAGSGTGSDHNVFSAVFQDDVLLIGIKH